MGTDDTQWTSDDGQRQGYGISSPQVSLKNHLSRVLIFKMYTNIINHEEQNVTMTSDVNELPSSNVIIEL